MLVGTLIFLFFKNICFCFLEFSFVFNIYLFMAVSDFCWSTWDLCSLIRDRTHLLCVGRQILNHWTTREVPDIFISIATS